MTHDEEVESMMSQSRGKFGITGVTWDRIKSWTMENLSENEIINDRKGEHVRDDIVGDVLINDMRMYPKDVIKTM